MSSTGPEKRGSVLGGTAWVVSARMTVRVVGTVSTIILARLLTPEDFGLVAVAMAVVGLLQAATEFGFNAALIRDQQASDDDYATAWTVDLLRGVLLALLLLVLAHPLADFLNDPRLAVLLSVLAVVPLLGGLYNPHFIDFDKRMNFRPFFILMLSVKVVGFVATVGLALVWRSYWVLIVGSLVSNVARTVLSFALMPYRPRFSLAGWRRLMAFSGWLAGSQFLGAIGTRMDNLILGKLLAAHGVGIFSVSRDLTAMAFQEITMPLRKVLFPAFSRMDSASDEFRQAYFIALSGLFMILAPIGVGLVLTAGDAVPVLLGGQWHEAVRPMQWFSLTAVFWVIATMAQTAAMSANRTRMIFYRNLFGFPVRLTLFILGGYYYGLLGAVIGGIASAALMAVLNLNMVARILGVTFVQHVRACRRSLGALAAMTVCVAAAQWAMPAGTDLASHSARLAVAVAAGAVVYPAVQLILWRAAGRPDGAEARIVKSVVRWRRGDAVPAQ